MTFARELWSRVESLHAVTYFSAESRDAARTAGLKGFWMGYFAFRAAPLGAVGPGIVEATFFNFAPPMVQRAIPDAWSFAPPGALIDARARSAASALRAAVPHLDAFAAALAANLATLGERGRESGRPMYAANRALPRRDDPVEALWQACTVIREHRGDGHVAALVTAGLDGLEAHVLFAAERGVDAALLRDNRGWTDADWGGAAARLADRKLLSGSGTITDAGRALREEIESTTDRLAGELLANVRPTDQDALLRDLDAIVDALERAGVIPFPNPMGLPRRGELRSAGG